MRKAIAIVLLAAGLAACGAISTLVDGLKYANAVASDLEQETGLKPEVGFNFHNDRLQSVTVAFPRLYDAKPIRELAETVRAAVVKEFKRAPDNIVLAFTLAKTKDTAALAGPPH